MAQVRKGRAGAYRTDSKPSDIQATGVWGGVLTARDRMSLAEVFKPSPPGKSSPRGKASRPARFTRRERRLPKRDIEALDG